MKSVIALLVVAVMAALVYGDTCPTGQSSECTGSHAHVHCTGSGYVPSCVDQVCTCSYSGSHTCTADSDCNSLGHCPGSLSWSCFADHFHHGSSANKRCHCRHH